MHRGGIKERYQFYKATGKLPYKAGRIDETYYDTMKQVAEQNNAEWNRLRREEGGRELSVDEEYLRVLNDNAYDYKGYYNKYPNGKGNAIDHWDDEFKTVYHPTFSTQSIYSGKKSQYNPEGVLGGQWLNDQYVPAWGQKLPHYEDGKDARKLEYHPEGDYYYGGNLFGNGNQFVVTGQRKQKPYWVTANTKQAGFDDLENMALVAGGGITPGISDVGDAAAVANDVYNKNYMSAGIGAGMFLVPNILEKPIRFIYKVARKVGIPQYFAKNMFTNVQNAFKYFKNADAFDRIRGIKYTDDVYHGSPNAFDIDNARTYSSRAEDSGFHLGNSPTPTYARANGVQGGVVYKGKIKLKEEPFEVRDLQRWGPTEIAAEYYNNPAFKKYLDEKGIDVDALLHKADELDKEYWLADGPGQQKWLRQHGGFESQKYLAKLFKEKNISFKYKNDFETFDGKPEYSYAIYNPQNAIWTKKFKFSKKQDVLNKMNDLGLAKNYGIVGGDGLPEYNIYLTDLYRMLQDFKQYTLPTSFTK